MKLRFLSVCVMLLGGSQPNDEATKQDLEKMQGDWAAVSTVVDGTKLSDDEAQSIFRTVKGKEYTILVFSKPVSKGTFTIDATAKPKTIDALPDKAADRTKPIRGIYELEGDRLKVCMAAPGKERPKEFDAEEGSGRSLTVWEREKK